MLRRYPEPSGVTADALKPERSQGARHEEGVASSYDETIHNGRFFQENFLFIFSVALFVLLAVFAALLAVAT
jgi:hypothetical protein